MTTHNPYLDRARAIVAEHPFPTSVPEHDLNLAVLLAKNARAQLVEAFRLCQPDNVLRYRAETAGKAATDLMAAASARLGQIQ